MAYCKCTKCYTMLVLDGDEFKSWEKKGKVNL